MRVFVTGGSGFIGSAIVPELIGAGHEVLGLARSDESAAALEAAGADVHRGSLEDVDSLRRGAAEADGVIHCAFIHDFSALENAGRTDLQAIEEFGAELEGSERPLVVTSGIGLLKPGELATEDDRPDPDSHASHRAPSELATLALAERGVRSALVRLPPTVHGEGDHGFVPIIIDIARERGEVGYAGDGSNHWCAVHRLDAARLFRLAVESAPAGSVLHGVAEEGVPTRDIAEVISRHLDLPATSIAPEDTVGRLGWIGAFFAADLLASSALTRELTGWRPEHPELLADLDAGHYFAPAPSAAA